MLFCIILTLVILPRRTAPAKVVPHQLRKASYSVNAGFLKLAAGDCRSLGRSCGGYGYGDPVSGLKILGGHGVDVGRWPYAVAFYGTSMRGGIVTGSPFCTGSLISRRHALTTAHCFGLCATESEPEPYAAPRYVYAKVAKVDAQSGTAIEVDAVHVHDFHRRNCTWDDIALVQLAGDVDFEQMHAPQYGGPPVRKYGAVCLPAPDEQLRYSFMTYGYGIDPGHAVSSRRHGTLQEVYQTLADNRTCRRLGMRRYVHYSDQLICTVEAGLMPCVGDSGGPLMQRARNGRDAMTVVGLTHIGSRCSEFVDLQPDELETEYARRGTLFIDVRPFVRWICEKTGVCYSVKRELATPVATRPAARRATKGPRPPPPTSTKTTTRRPATRRPTGLTATVQRPTRAPATRTWTVVVAAETARTPMTLPPAVAALARRYGVDLRPPKHPWTPPVGWSKSIRGPPTRRPRPKLTTPKPKPKPTLTTTAPHSSRASTRPAPVHTKGKGGEPAFCRPLAGAYVRLRDGGQRLMRWHPRCAAAFGRAERACTASPLAAAYRRMAGGERRKHERAHGAFFRRCGRALERSGALVISGRKASGPRL